MAKKKRTKNWRRGAVKVLKKLSLFLIVIMVAALGLLVAAQVLVGHYQDRIARALLTKLENKSGHLYAFSYDRVEIDLWGESVHLWNLAITLNNESLEKIRRETAKNRLFIHGTVPLLKIDGISLFDMVFKKNPTMDKILLDGGALTLVKIKKNGKPGEKSTPQKAAETPIRQGGNRRSYYAGVLVLNRVAVKLVEPGQKHPVFTVPAATLKLKRLKLVTGRKKSPRVRFSFKAAEATLTRPQLVFDRGFYTLKAEEVFISRTGSFAFADQVEIVPAYKKYHFARAKGYRTSRLALTVERLFLEGINFKKLFNKQSLSASLLTVQKPRLDIFRNKKMPVAPGKKPPKFPIHLLDNLKFELDLDRVRLSDGHLQFTEHPPGGRRTGNLTLTHVAAELTPLTNTEGRLKPGNASTLSLSARLMGRARMKTVLWIPHGGKNQFFKFSGAIGPMDLRDLNPFLRAGAFIRIDSGSLKRLRFSIRADKRKARGEMQFVYNDLKVAMLKKNGSNIYKKRKFVSFLANTIINEDNPPLGRKLRVGRIYLEPEGPLPFLSYIFKSLLTGIKSSVGLKKRKK